MTKINANMASFLAQILDAKDGKCDGKISANIWNEFVQGKGGKTIKYYITVENATRSISTYLSKNSQSTGRSKEGLCVDWVQQQDSTPYDNEKMKNIGEIMGFEAQNKKNSLKPEAIEKDANAIVDFINGKTEQFYVNPNNAAQVFLKASEKFKDSKFPKTMGTSLYLMYLYPSLIKKAKELGISSYYKENQKFENIEEKLAACRDLSYQIIEKEKGLPQNKVI